MPTPPFTVDRRAHQARGRLDGGAQVVIGELAEPRPRREPRRPESLGLPEIPDAGDEPLVEQRIAELAALVGAPQVRDDRVEVGRDVEDVGSEPPDDVAGELEHGTVPEHALVLLAAQHQPGTAEPFRAALLEPPASGHAQVAAENEPAFEPQEEVLADGFDRFEAAAVEALRDSLRRCTRVRSLDLDALADERLQTSRCEPQRITFGHRAAQGSGSFAPVNHRRSAAAGATAALAWAALEPLDQRLFRSDYSDVALLGKLVTRSGAWRPAGLAIHMLNGAVFGLAYRELHRRRGWSALRLALVEHVALYPLSALVDRHHPARGTYGVPRLLRARPFLQATFRHVVFGVVLGRLAAEVPTVNG
jgi:hypothetical protein